jgi:hypothetical protein
LREYAYVGDWCTDEEVRCWVAANIFMNSRKWCCVRMQELKEEAEINKIPLPVAR